MILDVVVFVALVVSSGIAFFRGFVREAITILAIGGAIAIAVAIAPFLSPLLETGLDMEEGSVWAGMLSYMLVFVPAAIILSIVIHNLTHDEDTPPPGIADRSCGLIFGIARAVVFITMFYLPYTLLIDEEVRAEWFDGSVSLPYVEKAAGVVVGVIPEEAADEIKEQSEETMNKARAVIIEKMKEHYGESQESEEE